MSGLSILFVSSGISGNNWTNLTNPRNVLIPRYYRLPVSTGNRLPVSTGNTVTNCPHNRSPFTMVWRMIQWNPHYSIYNTYNIKNGSVWNRVSPVKNDSDVRDLTFSLSPPGPPRKNIHNRDLPLQKSPHQDSPSPMICPRDRVKTSRAHISSPLPSNNERNSPHPECDLRHHKSNQVIREKVYSG